MWSQELRGWAGTRVPRADNRLNITIIGHSIRVSIPTSWPRSFSKLWGGAAPQYSVDAQALSHRIHGYGRHGCRWQHEDNACDVDAVCRD